MAKVPVRALQVTMLIAALMANLYWARPYYNWDMLPYIAAAFRFSGASEEAAHQRTYEIVRETVPPREYESLTESGEYRRVVANDPEALAQQLPFYAVKPVYPLLILVLERCGVNPVRATVLISRAAYVLIGLVLLLWLAPMQSVVVSGLSAWGVMSLPFVLDLARLSTPDALSTLIVLTALWLVFEARRFRSGVSLLLLATAVRPDNLLWLLVVAGYGALRLRRGRVAAGFAIAGIAVYLGLAHWSGNLGWATLFHHSFVQLLPYPEGFEPDLSPAGYLWIYLLQAHPVNLPRFLLLFVLMGIWLFAHRFRRYGWTDTSGALLAATGVFVVLHWALLPGAEDRYLTVAYVVILVLLIQTLISERDERATELHERRLPTPV